MIGGVLIDAVDEGGYLRADLGEIAERSAHSERRVARAHRHAGLRAHRRVRARHSQNAWRCSSRSATASIRRWPRCSDNLELLARRDIAGLQKACGVDDEDLREMIAELRGADAPARRGVRRRAGAADRAGRLSCARRRGGIWHVELNTDTLPRLLVDQRYHARCRQRRAPSRRRPSSPTAWPTPTGW